MKSRKYSKEFFVKWMKEHGRLPNNKNVGESNIVASLNLYRKRDPELNSLALSYANTKGIRMDKDLQKLGLFLAESGGSGWF